MGLCQLQPKTNKMEATKHGLAPTQLRHGLARTHLQFLLLIASPPPHMYCTSSKAMHHAECSSPHLTSLLSLFIQPSPQT
eukprot:m.43683 g.43683  ORF g.43683 m.43683 type:complete len:80 (+) comp10787_c0_seq4:4349-4588(+)